jgi:outer membrane biosynthesis protein TonB
MISRSPRFREPPGGRTPRGTAVRAPRNPPRRIVSKGLLLLSPLVLALLGALLFAGSAPASTPEIRSPAPTPGVIPELPPLPIPETPTPTPTPEVPAETPPTPTPETPTPVPTPEPTPETPRPAPTPEPTPETPPPAPEATPETPPPTTEKTPEAPAPPAPEAEAKSAPSPALAPSQDAAGEIPPAATGAATGSLPTASAVDGRDRAAATPSAHPVSLSASAGLIAAQAMSLSCELAGLERRMSDRCTAGSPAVQRLFAASLVPLGSANPADSSLASTVRAPTDPDPGGSGVRSRPPVSPAPSPAPGGAAGFSASGASGLGLSAFLTLGALLRLAPARAMRRLRLSCEPWLTACFVLIPERPG